MFWCQSWRYSLYLRNVHTTRTVNEEEWITNEDGFLSEGTRALALVCQEFGYDSTMLTTITDCIFSDDNIGKLVAGLNLKYAYRLNMQAVWNECWINVGSSTPDYITLNSICDHFLLHARAHKSYPLLDHVTRHMQHRHKPLLDAAVMEIKVSVDAEDMLFRYFRKHGLPKTAVQGWLTITATNAQSNIDAVFG